MTALLEMTGIAKAFGAVRALDGVDVAFRAGEVHALLGENGAGKSTLMKVLSGALAPDAGTCTLGGVPYAPSGPHDALASGVAMIYQELNLAPDLTVEQNVLLGREPRRLGVVDRRRMRAAVKRVLDLLGAGDVAPDTRVADLGPGRRQLVEIARALVADPSSGFEDTSSGARVVVFDEPTSSLSRKDTERLFAVVARLAADGVAVVYISHFLEEVREVADHFTVLRDGRTVGSGTVAGTPLADIITLMAGRDVDEFFPRVPHEPGEVALSLRAFAGSGLPVHVDLDVRAGEILGIAGLVGAGRTEMLRALFALDPVTGGEVRIAGVPAAARGPRERLAQGLGLLSEDRKGEGLNMGLSVAVNTTLSHLAPLARFGVVSRAAQGAATRRWIERLDLRCGGPWQPVRALSGGNQQKVAIARLLHRDARIFLLDEPTRGVDVGAKVEVYRLMGELAAAGKTVLVVSSYIPELLGVCDRIAVMHRGRLGPPRAAGQWTETELLDEATRGVA